MAKKLTYFVSGIIQIEVTASSPEEAKFKALQRQAALMKSPSLNVSVDNMTEGASGRTIDLNDVVDVGTRLHRIASEARAEAQVAVARTRTVAWQDA